MSLDKRLRRIEEQMRGANISPDPEARARIRELLQSVERKALEELEEGEPQRYYALQDLKEQPKKRAG